MGFLTPASAIFQLLICGHVTLLLQPSSPKGARAPSNEWCTECGPKNANSFSWPQVHSGWSENVLWQTTRASSRTWNFQMSDRDTGLLWLSWHRPPKEHTTERTPRIPVGSRLPAHWTVVRLAPCETLVLLWPMSAFKYISALNILRSSGACSKRSKGYTPPYLLYIC